MEIKRRLNKIASNLSPQIEVMNVADEMRRMCERFEELVRYAQEKIDRSAERKETIGQTVAFQKEAIAKEIEDHQTAEAEENLKDQEESFEERNRLASKSKRPEEAEGKIEKEDGTVMYDTEAVVPEGQVGLTDEQLNPAKKKAKKKKAKKKAKKK